MSRRFFRHTSPSTPEGPCNREICRSLVAVNPSDRNKCDWYVPPPCFLQRLFVDTCRFCLKISSQCLSRCLAKHARVHILPYSTRTKPLLATQTKRPVSALTTTSTVPNPTPTAPGRVKTTLHVGTRSFSSVGHRRASKSQIVTHRVQYLFFGTGHHVWAEGLGCTVPCIFVWETHKTLGFEVASFLSEGGRTRYD